MQLTAVIYVFHPSSYQRDFEDAMNAGSFGRAQYRFKHESVFYAHLKSKAPT
ncbi:hypothetical protein ABEW60_17060 [Paenibacillus jamilae]|uniref:hypothetical protein n=1 Tax=Paenibacillus jamilae TaxID=114136 RepID=UPI003D2E3234